MPRFHNQRCFSVWNGFFGQVEFGLDGALYELALFLFLVCSDPFVSSF